ncbi:peptidase M20 [Skermanella stibiiresistens SB22]|uniref:Peptidase M20 n=1 Tax=Skermanella stibiiresistens SB22 TaxID=1385369 RepID=W9H6S8_9PROT|nr:allantoate amidohydrolase [Skermanella stibiiresistens]EWY41940.1 peptidase M20 [Skermanella stibiiresistens SB22]
MSSDNSKNPPTDQATDQDAVTFVARHGGIFEHSPWVAETALAADPTLPHADIETIHARMCAAVRAAGHDRQLALLRAHPDLAGKLAVAGGLTADSASEQAGAGLDRCTPEEFDRLQTLNEAYQEKFGFPFIIAVRGLGRADILDAFERRIHNTPDQEFETALAQVERIALLRLRQLAPATTFGEALMDRLARFATITSEPGVMTRLFLTPEHRAAADQLMAWMTEAGMTTRLDAAANVIGRYEGATSGLPALLIGSHIDTVRNAGIYDGNFGVLAGVAAVAELHRGGERLPFAIEVIGFGDEEGVRFPVTLTGSRALAGHFDPKALTATDAAGIGYAEALRAFGGDPDAIPGAARDPATVLAYVEAHIEQGPVLEAENLGVGVVTGINGASRFTVTVTGMAGHAGTVPMNLRHDALAGTAEMILAVERHALEIADLVATVGKIEAMPGAINVIPGGTRFTIDIRSPDDAMRMTALDAMATGFQTIAERRGLTVAIEKGHEAPATACHPALIAQISASVERFGVTPRLLPSGAGHDAMAVASLCPVGMLFTRCRGGVSHNPAESITVEDADLTVRVLLDFIRRFDASSLR